MPPATVLNDFTAPTHYRDFVYSLQAHIHKKPHTEYIKWAQKAFRAREKHFQLGERQSKRGG